MGDPVLLDEILGGSTSFLTLYIVTGFGDDRKLDPKDRRTMLATMRQWCVYLEFRSFSCESGKVTWFISNPDGFFPSIVCLDGFSKVETSTWTIHHTPFTIRISIHDMMFPLTLDGWIFWGATQQSLRKLQHLLRGSKSEVLERCWFSSYRLHPFT